MSIEKPYPSTYDGLRRLVQQLRERCPWDRQQTRDSMKRPFVEECYEFVEAIERGDVAHVVEELGDVMFHLAFQMQLGAEAGEFTQEEVFGSLVEKLVRRHPHVFGDAQATDAIQVKDNWDAIKREETAGTEASILGGVPSQMPALSHAQTVQGRAARVGFDWEDVQGVLDKVPEELLELEKARTDAERESEFGDLLFSMVNAARWTDVDAEAALRRTNARFRRRFAGMERLCRERDLSFVDLSLEEKEALWEEVKESQ